MKKAVLDIIYAIRQEGRKGLAMLLDPDHVDPADLPGQFSMAEEAGVDLFLLGGSLLTQGSVQKAAPLIKQYTSKPVVLFPGSVYQLAPEADALLFLSLISGRNPELLIGKHVEAAPLVREMNLEVIPTGYMLIDSGAATTASYISNTIPIPHNKPDVAACTALAGMFLGLKLIYMDGGSGAKRMISPEMIAAVRATVDLPIIIGGGVRSPEDAALLWEAGADIVVVGNALEKDPEGALLMGLGKAKAFS
ncbi:MAG: geranylgeranylglyceryl/heptaprenylglyceryl phosphate synthase [Bacteroidia bacterium]